MKKAATIFFIICLLTTFSEKSHSQQGYSLKCFQAEISQLIHNIKFSIVTVSSKSTHSYTIDKNDGLISLLWNDIEEKKGEISIVGSGIIYNEEGYIITKSSTLANFEEIKVTLSDRREFEAEYIGTDEFTGLAIIKINADNLKPAVFGNSDKLPLYSIVLIIGNSMGISPAASFGLINSITEQKLFIVSAPITPGVSGAGMFNLEGKLVGIISAQLTPTDDMLNQDFLCSLPQNGIVLAGNQVKQITDEIIRMRHEQKGWLGIDVDLDSLAKGKIVISRVVSGSPANRSGLKKGDWLLKFNDSFFTSLEQFASLIENTKPGTIVSIDFIRDNRPLKVFPQIAPKRPSNFNPNKPRISSASLKKLNSRSTDSQPMLISRQYFQQINLQIKKLENEVELLKRKLKQAQQ